MVESVLLPTTAFEYDESDQTYKLAQYEYIDGIRTRVRLSEEGMWVTNDGNLAHGKFANGSPKSWYGSDAQGDPVIRFGPEAVVGKNKVKTNQVVTSEVVVDSGASLITTGEDGTPLHITFKKVGQSWQMTITEMTDAELSNRGLHRGQFKGKNP